MLTPDQEEWIAHLSDNDHVTIIPFDETAGEKFEAVKQSIQRVLGANICVEHRGATSLGISGQDEIDVYIPVPENRFDSMLPALAVAFGDPRSLYPRERARFVTVESGKHVDIFLINESCKGWLDGVKFENYLRSHPSTLNRYRLLKESGHGLSTRAYYRRKIVFINEILSLAGQDDQPVQSLFPQRGSRK
jgi:GrpB-like predicted nucleotidyltransferase (UPF0157 family)